MKSFYFILGVTFSSVSFSYPMDDIYENLDITSFTSSLMQKRIGNEIHFSELNLPKPKLNDSSIVMSNDRWTYKLTVTKEYDKDLHVCFIDKAKQGTYNAQSAMILRKYGEDYVAISMNSSACDDFAM